VLATRLCAGDLKGNFLHRFFVMKDEIKLFSEMKANELLSHISDNIWLKKSCLFGSNFWKV